MAAVRRTSSHTVANAREIATTPTPSVEEDPLMLYQPITKQVDAEKVPWTIEYLLVTPQQAQVWLDQADQYQKFGQRPRTKARIKRWLGLYQSSRYAFFNPMAALCFNEDGVLMNGGNRLAALAQHDKPVGFMVVRDCPTWLINYFDNGATRSRRDAAFINKRDVKPITLAIVRLGMRYEEFIFGKRSELGWADWGRHQDEHVDVENFMTHREYLMDFATRGQTLSKKTGLQASSGACFIAYQQLAWPEGVDWLEKFLDGLQLGVMLEKGDPALTLREWARNDGYIGGYTHGRREGHLLLLFKFFTLFMEEQKVSNVLVARGFPMAMPYHPQGWDIASKNVREALIALDD